MPKRYTDTEKWKKKWFRTLTPEEKAVWFFITEQCDNVGVWDGDFEAAEFTIGAKIDWESFLERTNKNIEVLECGKWWLIDYCAFQHTDLSPESKSKPVISYIKLLKKHNLYERVMKALVKPLDSLSKGLKEKEKEREEEKEREREEVKELPDKESKKKTKEPKTEYAEKVFLTKKQYNILVHDYEKGLTDSSIEILSNYKCSKNKKYDSDYHALLTWAIKEAAGRDRQLVKADVAKRRDDNEAQKKVMDKIKKGKLEKRLSPAELSELTKSITDKSDFLNGQDNKDDSMWDE